MDRFIVALCTLAILTSYVQAGDLWEYSEGDRGPPVWSKSFPQCGGTRQSPINIDTRHVEYNPGLSNFQFTGWDQPQAINSMKIKNNGHTAQVDIDGDLWIEGAGLEGRYRTAQFHFHWGSDESKGSEHTLNGMPYAMELHIVHYSERYGNISNALLYPDGLAVLGYFFEVTEQNNTEYDDLLNDMEKVQYRGANIAMKPFKLSSLVPTQKGTYFRYDGSLTTPSCHESVIWTVFEKRIQMSEDRFEKFRSLCPDPEPNNVGTGIMRQKRLYNNYRPIQPLHGRKVFTNRPPYQRHESEKSYWTYENDENGPSQWSNAYGVCRGTRQSPININTKDVNVVTNLKRFVFHGWDNKDNVTLKLKNNGHTVQVDIDGNLYIEGGGLTGRYITAQFHFHWGFDDSKGSEHTVNGKRYPLEMHIVNYAEKYGNISHAMLQSDGLAVLGFFFEIDDNNVRNVNYNPIFNHFREIEYKDGTCEVEPFAMSSILPKDLRKYFRYDGSLTTPGCYESVIWTIFTDTVKISRSQLKKFRTLYSIGSQHHAWNQENSTSVSTNIANVKRHSLNYIVDNFRPVQELYGRIVYSTFQPKTDYQEDEDEGHWTYTGDKMGPIQWHKHYASCAGRRQSPINIVSTKTRHNKILTDFKFYNWNSVLGCQMKVKNNGHTVQVDVDGEQYIEGGGLEGRYRTAQFHFHWGAEDWRGSEHTIDGESFPMELHIVHYAEKYGNLSNAVDKPDGLSVLSFMFKLSDSHNLRYNDLLAYLEAIQYKGQDLPMTPFPLTNLVPETVKYYYRYLGSLTTPGCHESVIWTIFHEPIHISSEQLEHFRLLYEIDQDDFNMKREMGEFWDLAYADPNAATLPKSNSQVQLDLQAVDATKASSQLHLHKFGNHPETDRRKHYHIVDNFRPIQYTFGRVVHTNRPEGMYRSQTSMQERKIDVTCDGCENEYSKVLISGLCFLYMKACSNI